MPQRDNKKLLIANAVLLPEVIALVERGHSVTLPLRGCSMRPFLEDGRDKALLVKADAGTLKCGDVVLAEIVPHKYVLHRLVGISGNNITLLGDGNLTPEHCRLDDVKAVAIGFYRKGNATLDSVGTVKWRLYSAVWMFLRPMRRYLLAVYRLIEKH